MPLIVKCSNCGYIFYYSSNVIPLEEILASLPQRCLRCGKPLKKKLKEMDVEKDIKINTLRRSMHQ